MAVKYSEIMYIKGVNDARAYTLAYGNQLKNSKFKLHFHENMKTNAEKLTKKDVIVLFQKVHDNANASVTDELLTHLVRPLYDNTVNHDMDNKEYPWSIDVQVESFIPGGSTALNGVLNFQNKAFGNVIELDTAINGSGKSLKDVQNDILKLFP